MKLNSAESEGGKEGRICWYQAKKVETTKIRKMKATGRKIRKMKTTGFIYGPRGGQNCTLVPGQTR
jgi:hypothetical protein